MRNSLLKALGACLCIFLCVACGRTGPAAPAAITAISNAPAANTPTDRVPTAQQAATSTAIPSATIAPSPTPAAELAVNTTTPQTYTIDLNAPLVVNGQLRTTTLVVGGQSLTVELASTYEQREIGLMNRPSMAADAGMLFIFANDQPLSFWMRNTLIPLSIAFIDSQYTILNIEDMAPLDEQTFHLSAGPARYALEVNQGWFATHNIKPGDTIQISLPTDLQIN